MLKKEKIIIYLDRTIEFSLCVLIFTLPFSKSMVEICFGAALVCWVAKRLIIYPSLSVKAFKPVSTKLNIPIYAFVFLGFLSTVFSVSLLLSLKGFFFKLFQWAMIYFIVVEVINSSRKINRMLVILLLSMILINVNGIYQFITGMDFIRGRASYAHVIRSSFDNPNGFAAWLLVMAPLALSLAYFGKNTRIIKLMLWLLTGVLIFCLISTDGGGAWIAAFLSLIFIGIFRHKKLLVIAIAIVLILPFVIPDHIKESPGLLLSSRDINVNVRTELWQEALSIVKDFPLLGSGLNTYAVVALDYKITERGGTYPHNSYLHMAADSGILGLGAFIWIIIILFKTSFANLKRIDDKFYSALLIGFLAGLFGFLVHSFVDVNIYMLQLGNLMWFIVGLIIAVQKVSLEG